MSPLPLVTVITPSYNRANYLPETIESVLNQDYPHIEYIVLDDGSTDNTAEVLQRYNGRITWGSHPNMGETLTVNKGLAMAQGDYLLIVNSDDPILPGLISKAVALMQSQPDLLVVYPDWVMIDQHSNEIERPTTPDYDYLTMLRTHYCNPGPGALIRRRAYELEGGRNPLFSYVGDYDYWLRVGLHGPFARLPEHLATFRVHPGSATQAQKGLKMAHEHITMLDQLYQRDNLPEPVLMIRSEAYSAGYFIAANILFTNDQQQAARRYYLQALRTDPQAFMRRTRPEKLVALRSLLPARTYHLARHFKHQWQNRK